MSNLDDFTTDPDAGILYRGRQRVAKCILNDGKWEAFATLPAISHVANGTGDTVLEAFGAFAANCRASPKAMAALGKADAADPVDYFSRTFTVTELVTTRHITDVFNRAERMTRIEAATEASKDDVVLVLGISESQGDGLLIVRKNTELPRLVYYSDD